MSVSGTLDARKGGMQTHPSTQRSFRLAVLTSFAVALTGCGGPVVGGDGGTGGGGGRVDGGSGGGSVGGGGGGGAVGGGGGSAALGPARVDLGSTTDLAAPGSYVLLAKTAITNVTGSSVSGGALGLSPAAASFITGFALVADASNVFSTSASVPPPGKVYASNYAPPTPSNLTIAVLAMQAAYSDAAGRTTPNFLNLGAGNVGGLTLAPGLYTWGTSVTIPTNVTISGGANDVWIFQVANDLDLSTATSVILAGGAQAKNIFWQVAGTAIIHANGHFEGIILSQTSVTLQTGASMHGRAYAQTNIALDNNAVTAP